MYEITFITKVEENSDVKDTIKKLDGKILEEQKLGRKKFTFPIKKEEAGFYTSTIFEIMPEKLAALDKILLLKPEILRYLIIAKKVISESKKEKKIEKPAIVKEPIIPMVKPQTEKVEAEKIEKPKSKAEIKPASTEKIEVKKEEPKTEKEVVKEKVEKAPPKLKVESKEPKDEEERLKALEEKLEEILKD